MEGEQGIVSTREGEGGGMVIKEYGGVGKEERRKEGNGLGCGRNEGEVSEGAVCERT